MEGWGESGASGSSGGDALLPRLVDIFLLQRIAERAKNIQLDYKDNSVCYILSGTVKKYETSKCLVLGTISISFQSDCMHCLSKPFLGTWIEEGVLCDK